MIISFDDPGKLLEENDRLRRLLYSCGRKYNQIWRELEAIKMTNGFYEKPFLFLRLPREIRDRIYLYSLQASEATEVCPRQNYMLAVENYPWKPPTPGLLRTHKQIYREAVEILYSKNTIYFRVPQDIFDFEKQIRPSNRDLVQEIKINIIFPQPTEHEMGRGFVLSESDPYPSVWVKALPKSLLRNVFRMIVEADFVNAGEYPRASMPANLQKAVEGMLSRSHNHSLPVKLLLQCFAEGEENKFPNTWDVKTER